MGDMKEIIDQLNSGSFGNCRLRKQPGENAQDTNEGQATTNANKEADGNSTKVKPTYQSDIAMYMAWQNWQLMNYSWMMYNHAIMQNAVYLSSMKKMVEQNHQLILQHQQERQAASNPAPPQPTNQTEPRVVKLASVQSRVLAELIDFFILIVLKVFMIYYYYGEKYMERFSFVMIIDEKTSIDDLEWMLVQAMMFRLIVILYEAYMLSGTVPLSRGVTIGKSMMGIKTVYCQSVEEHNVLANTVRITNSRPLGMPRSCYRALLKNIAISFLFPMLLPIMVFRHNRLLYDIAAGSIVIEDDRLAAQRRRNQWWQ